MFIKVFFHYLYQPYYKNKKSISLFELFHEFTILKHIFIIEQLKIKKIGNSNIYLYILNPLPSKDKKYYFKKFSPNFGIKK